MPALASITINDRETTPVAHTFVPTDGGGSTGVAVVEEMAAIPEGNKSLSISRRKAGSKFKVRLVLKDPIVVTETINGVARSVVDRTSYADLTFTFDSRSSLQERKNTVGMLYNALASSVTLVDGVVTKLESVY